MSKQSSIEWLFDQFCSEKFSWIKGSNDKIYFDKRTSDLLHQAKAMHKEEVTDAYIECWMNDGGNGFHKVKEAEHYYNETFGGQDNE